MADVEDSALENNLCKKKKKGKKHKHHEIEEEDIVQPLEKHKKKKRKNKDEQAEIVKENTEDCKSNDNACDGHKKKKKKKKSKENKNEEDNLSPPVTKKKKNKHKGKDFTEEPDDVHVDDHNEMKEKRKKKRNKISVENITNNGEDIPNTKNKKKRHSEGSDDSISCKKSKSPKDLIGTVNVQEEETAGLKKKKKKRKHSRERAETVQEVTNSPKKLKKDTKTNLDQELKLTSNGVDVGKPPETKQDASEPIVGQWGTSSFGSDSRQQKFLRLMGGFKKGTNDANSLGNKKSKGLFGSLTSASSISNMASHGGGRAMDATQERHYLTAMEKDYERAMSMNLNRGIGLGFEKPPGEGKKFYIDTKASKSIKFDD